MSRKSLKDNNKVVDTIKDADANKIIHQTKVPSTTTIKNAQNNIKPKTDTSGNSVIHEMDAIDKIAYNIRYKRYIIVIYQ